MLTDPRLRKLSLIPWLFALVAYPLIVFGAFSWRAELLSLFVEPGETFLGAALYYAAAVFVFALLFIASSVATFLLVLLTTAFLQVNIAEHVLYKFSGYSAGAAAGVKATLAEILRSISIESLKLLWLGPAMVVALLLGLIPLLAPVGLLLAAWLLGYQFLDLVLDIFRMPILRRISFARKRTSYVLLFGLTIALLSAVPFLALFLTPAATAGAAWLVASSPLLDELLPYRPAPASERPD